MKKIALTAIATTALAFAACGDDEGESGESAENSVTPAVAIEEIGAVRTGLDEALVAYTDGDAAGAAETVNETYLQHFELVEGPLEEVDPELNEELEEQIREQLVAEIESDAEVPEVKGLVGEIERGLDDAEAALAAATSTPSEGEGG